MGSDIPSAFRAFLRQASGLVVADGVRGRGDSDVKQPVNFARVLGIGLSG